MKPKREPRRRRCCECRCWYRPTLSAAKTQRTCGKECRLRRRAKHEAARREADLPAARRTERARKRRERERQAVPGPPMSRAGLSAQSSAAIEEIVEKLGHAQRMSRAGLRRQLRRLALGELARASAESGT